MMIRWGKGIANMAVTPNYAEEECLNIYWKICNFSYFWKSIRSPEFIFSGSQYYLELQPYSNAIECKVKVQSSFLNPTGEISFLTCDGSPEESKSCNVGKGFLVSKDVILRKGPNSFLPEDTLTVRCRIPSTSDRGTVLIRSRIQLRRKCFLWTIKNFNKSHRNDGISLEKSDSYGNIQLDLKSVGGIHGDEQFYLEISQTGGEMCYCVLRVCVIDVEGKGLNDVSDEFYFCTENLQKSGQKWRYPPIIKNSKLLAYKDQLLPKGTLSLKCDFTTSLGTVSEQAVVISSCEDVTTMLKDSEDVLVSPGDKRCAKSPTDLQTDLNNMLDDGTLSDVTLQVGTEVIRVHKNILSARSPVFKSMFATDMKEAKDSAVIVSDLEVEIVRGLLLYMYTNTIHSYHREDIAKLYVAADKYQVLGLKQKCASFLEANLSSSNVCEVLVFADLYQDADLKGYVLDFISKNDSAVFASEEWKELEEGKPALACRTLREVYCVKGLK